VISLLTLGGAVPGLAQPAFDHLTTADGLAQSTVWEITQDRKGFIWMATADGLTRYDGHTFQVWRHQPGQPGSLPTNDIAALHADRRGTLWVAPRNGGLNRLRPELETFEHYPTTVLGESIRRASIGCFAEGPDHLWIGTSEHGLLCYDYRSNRVRRWPDARLGQSVTALLRVGDCLWIGTGRGGFFRMQLQTGELTRFEVPFPTAAEPHRIVSVIHRDRRGRYWVGTQGQGLFRFEPKTSRFTSVFFKPGVYETVNIILDVLDDRAGNLWVMTDHGALEYPSGEISQPIQFLPDPEQEKSLSTHALKKAFCDADGTLWIGTWQGGVNLLRARGEVFTALRHQPFNPQSLLTAKAAPLAADAAGGLWIGSNKGLLAVSPDQKRFRHFHQRNTALRADDINVLCPTSQGNLLVSAWPAGFSFYDTRKGRFTPVDGLGKSKAVSHFAQADSGRVWVATQDGKLFRFDERSKRLLALSLEPVLRVLETFSFNALLDDQGGSLWIGTYNTGLLCWNRRTGRVRHFTADGKPGSLGSNGIVSLFKDQRGQIWAGTNGGGLHRYEPQTGRFFRLTTRNGLANNYIAGILEDEHHALWLSTNGGISEYNPRTGALRNYDQRDGLGGKEFLPEASARLPSGELAFGSTQGLVVFHPDRLKEPTPAPRVYLTGLRVFNRPVRPTDKQAPTRVSLPDATQLTFRPEQSVFTLEFTGVSFQSNRNIRFAYKLEGLETDWNHVGEQRSATYTNLHEGEYTFLVKAAVGNSPWSTPRAVRVEVLPPWYRSWYTYLLYGLAVLGLLYALRRLILMRERLKADVRIKQIEADTLKTLDDAKTGFFTNVSHEFRTPLTLILAPLEKLTADSSFDARLQHQFQTIQRNAQRLLRLVNQLLDLSKLESGSLVPDVSRNDLVQFIGRIVESFEDWAEAKRITVHFQANFDAYEGFFDPDIVEKIVYNLLSNAFRFTPEGGEVRVGLTMSPGPDLVSGTLTVEDTGIGISEEALGHIFERFYQANGQQTRKKSGTGIGLALTRELVELHGGSVTVQSTPNVGTCFTVLLPLAATAYPAAWLAPDTEAIPILPTLLPDAVPEGLAVAPGKPAPLLLLVEDNDELRQYLKEHFSRHYHVLTAPDGQAALILARKHIPDLVISDWLMPEMDGVELCTALKRDEKTSHVPFLLLTSRSNNQSQISAFEAGIDDYTTKPFNLSILDTKARSLIQNRQVLREKWSRTNLAQPSDVQLPPMEEQFVQKIIALVETHLDDPHFDVDQLETALNLSRMQLYRKLKSITNLSATEFIRQVRLRRAVQLLESGHFNVSEVAYRVGFNDPAYFSRCFKKSFGKAPQEFIERREQKVW